MLSNDRSFAPHNNFTASCVKKQAGSTFTTTSAKNETYSTGVNIGSISVSAQPGHTAGMHLTVTFSSRSTSCGNNAAGPVQSSQLDSPRGVRLGRAMMRGWGVRIGRPTTVVAALGLSLVACGTGNDPPGPSLVLPAGTHSVGSGLPISAPNVPLSFGAITVCLNRPGSVTVDSVRPKDSTGGLTPYGRALSVGAFRCASQPTGISCTLRRTARGFTINSAGVIRV